MSGKNTNTAKLVKKWRKIEMPDTSLLMGSVTYRLKQLLTRPRTFFRAWRGLGLVAALNLIRIRLGSRQRAYRLRVPQWPHPIYVRGGASTDALVLYEILATGEYDHMGDLGSPKFMIDGGANVGFASLQLLNRYPDMQLVAVEPDPQTIELCRKNLAPYAKRVTILQGAIWNHPGRICLQPNHEEFATSVRNSRVGEEGSVEAFTLSSIIAAYGKGRPVDLLKLDVEGGEKEIFKPGCLPWLSTVRNIVIELHGADCENRFFSAIKPFQFEMSNRDDVYFCSNLRLRWAAAIPGSL